MKHFLFYLIFHLSKLVFWKFDFARTDFFFRPTHLGSDFWEGVATKHFSMNKRVFNEKGGRKGNSMKRSGSFNEPLDSENCKNCCPQPLPENQLWPFSTLKRPSVNKIYRCKSSPHLHSILNTNRMEVVINQNSKSLIDGITQLI